VERNPIAAFGKRLVLSALGGFAALVVLVVGWFVLAIGKIVASARRPGPGPKGWTRR
jgi:hypothetical protein